MSEIKISQLPETNSINDNDVVMIVQNNVNKKITYGNMVKKLKSVTLYADSSGTSGNVVLSDNPTKYKKIEIYGKRVGHGLFTAVMNPTIDDYIDIGLQRIVNNEMYIYSKQLQIKADRLEKITAGLIAVGTSEIYLSDDIFITNVIGYL